MDANLTTIPQPVGRPHISGSGVIRQLESCMANLHLFRRPGTGRPSLEVLEVMLESSFNMWYALRVMSTPEPKSREKYSTALAVIDEILPRREMLGPVGDSEI